MTTQQIIALANAGFTAQQIDAFSQAMGANSATMNPPINIQQMPMTQQAPPMPMTQQTPPMPMTQQTPPMPMTQQTPPMPMTQQTPQYSANAQELIAQERARQLASMNQAPAVTPQVTIGMGGNAGNASMSPQVLAQYQAHNRYNAGMSIEKPPTMEDITDQIVNGAVQEASKK